MLFLLVLSATVSSQEGCPQRTAEEGNKTYLDCQCGEQHIRDQFPPITGPKAGDDIACHGVIVQWFYDANYIGYCINGDIYIADPYNWTMTINEEGQLVIYPTYLNNTGEYACEREDTQGSTVYITDLHVHGESDVFDALK